MKSIVTLTTFPSPADLIPKLADHIIDLAKKAITASGSCHLCLAGGNTPKMLYSYLSRPACSGQLDWKQIHLYWGDERCVPPDHPDSNYRMTRETLLQAIPIPDSNIHRIQAELPPEAAAHSYERTLQQHLPKCRFNIVLLGLGTDAHTASIFPTSTAIRDTQHLVCSQYVKKLNSWRITLTPNSLNNADSIIVLAVGDNKANALKHVLEDPFNPDQFPAQMLNPSKGSLEYWVDQTASHLLTP